MFGRETRPPKLPRYGYKRPILNTLEFPTPDMSAFFFIRIRDVLASETTGRVIRARSRRKRARHPKKRNEITVIFRVRLRYERTPTKTYCSVFNIFLRVRERFFFVLVNKLIARQSSLFSRFFETETTARSTYDQVVSRVWATNDYDSSK